MYVGSYRGSTLWLMYSDIWSLTLDTIDVSCSLRAKRSNRPTARNCVNYFSPPHALCSAVLSVSARRFFELFIQPLRQHQSTAFWILVPVSIFLHLCTFARSLRLRCKVTIFYYTYYSSLKACDAFKSVITNVPFTSENFIVNNLFSAPQISIQAVIKFFPSYLHAFMKLVLGCTTVHSVFMMKLYHVFKTKNL